MSSSSAPSARSFAAEKALTSVRSVPWGKPRTEPTRTPEPASSRTASAVWRGWTINNLKWFARALWQPARISASVVVGFRIEKSNELASSSRVIIMLSSFLSFRCRGWIATGGSARQGHDVGRGYDHADRLAFLVDRDADHIGFFHVDDLAVWQGDLIFEAVADKGA